MDFTMDKAKTLLDSGIAEAQELIKDPSKIDGILKALEEKLREIPAVGENLSDLPLMVAMVKGYITKEYTEVSPKVIATLVGAFVYLVKKKDIIPDHIPVLGIADDLAVLTLALKLCGPELAAFKAFRDGTAEEAAEEPEDQESREEAPEDQESREEAPEDQESQEELEEQAFPDKMD